MKFYLHNFGDRCYKVMTSSGECCYTGKMPQSGDVLRFLDRCGQPIYRAIDNLADLDGKDLLKWQAETKMFLGD